ncbi:MAG: sporulation transcription factor Spo0A [bacterium]|jgi:two-component system response regulator (stage 0 sporulation protein A)
MGEKKVRIVIADDSQEFRQVLKDYLCRQPDMEVTGVAGNGAEAVEILPGADADVLLLDNIMPHLDGIGVLERMQQMQLPHRPKVIMLTAFGQENVARQVMATGADYYIMKPFSLDTLAHRIRQISSGQAPCSYAPAPLPDGRRDPGEEVTNLIRDIGVPAHIKGYQYLRAAILLALEDMEIMGAVTKELYPSVAKRFATTPERVERAIRHAIEVACDRGNADLLRALFGQQRMRQNKPTNSEFIATAADKLRMQLKVS